MGKKGRSSQKKLQGAKLKAVTKAKKAKVAKAKTKIQGGKGKGRKGGSQAVSLNLKKMPFASAKKIEALNGEVTKMLLATPKLNFLSAAASTPRTLAGPSKSKKKAAKNSKDMVDVGDIAQQFASL